MLVRNYRELFAWQKAFDLAIAVIQEAVKSEPQNIEPQNVEFRSHRHCAPSAVRNSSFDILRFDILQRNIGA